MRVDGRWHRFRDDVLRPVIDGAVQLPAGSWQSVTFLLDAGADRTVFDASFLPLLSPFILSTAQTPEIGGVGGKVDCIFVQTRLAFARHDGKQVLEIEHIIPKAKEGTDDEDNLYSVSYHLRDPPCRLKPGNC